MPEVESKGASEAEPLHPEVVVDLAGQLDKPVACVAMVRRHLQRAGHDDAAKRFTEEALAGSDQAIVDTARRYVTLIV